MTVADAERAVFAAVIRQRGEGSGKPVVVADKTIASHRLHRGDTPISSEIVRWRLKLRGLTDATARAFVTANETPGAIDTPLALDLSTQILTEAESDAIWRSGPEARRGGRRDGWVEFRRRYPNAAGVVHFSRVGFDRSHDQALVELAVQRHWLMGSAELILLSWVDGNWRRADSLLLSLS